MNSMKNYYFISRVGNKLEIYSSIKKAKKRLTDLLDFLDADEQKGRHVAFYVKHLSEDDVKKRYPDQLMG